MASVPVDHIPETLSDMPTGLTVEVSYLEIWVSDQSQLRPQSELDQ